MSATMTKTDDGLKVIILAQITLGIRWGKDYVNSFQNDTRSTYLNRDN